MKTFFFFDLDGTLADTDPDIRGAWKTVFDRLGLSCPDFDEKFVAGPPLEEMLRTLLPDVYTDALEAQARIEFGKAYDTCGFLHTPEYPGVMDAVRRIKSHGGRVFIVTNKRLLGARALAAKYGWMDVFEGLYTGDMFEGRKLRKPELLKYVIETLGAPKDECVMIGDTISDFEAAHVNAIASIAVQWGYGKPNELALADRIVQTSDELR